MKGDQNLDDQRWVGWGGRWLTPLAAWLLGK